MGKTEANCQRTGPTHQPKRGRRRREAPPSLFVTICTLSLMMMYPIGTQARVARYYSSPTAAIGPNPGLHQRLAVGRCFHYFPHASRHLSLATTSSSTTVRTSTHNCASPQWAPLPMLQSRGLMRPCKLAAFHRLLPNIRDYQTKANRAATSTHRRRHSGPFTANVQHMYTRF
jgi:hypothetical protein